MTITGRPPPLSAAQLRWGIEQWVAFLKDKEIPVLQPTQEFIRALRAHSFETDEPLSPKELSDFASNDPYLALKLLRQAEQRRSRRLGNETTTPLAAVLQTGVDELFKLIDRSSIITETHPGWHVCTSRAVMAANIARAWSSFRADVSPDEISLAALLSESGELLLWHFAPELPIKALDELNAGRAFRTTAAQQQVAGFTFKQLTLTLAQSWELPALIGMLIRGTDTARANIARLAIDTARHIMADYQNPALPSDIINIKVVLPGISLDRLISPLPLPDDQKAAILEAVRQETTVTTDPTVSPQQPPP